MLKLALGVFFFINVYCCLATSGWASISGQNRRLLALSAGSQEGLVFDQVKKSIYSKSTTFMLPYLVIDLCFMLC